MGKEKVSLPINVPKEGLKAVLSKSENDSSPDVCLNVSIDREELKKAMDGRSNASFTDKEKTYTSFPVKLEGKALLILKEKIEEKSSVGTPRYSSASAVQALLSELYDLRQDNKL